MDSFILVEDISKLCHQMGVWLLCKHKHKIWLTYNLVTISQQKNNENGCDTAEVETPLKVRGKNRNN